MIIIHPNTDPPPPPLLTSTTRLNLLSAVRHQAVRSYSLLAVAPEFSRLSSYQCLGESQCHRDPVSPVSLISSDKEGQGAIIMTPTSFALYITILAFWNAFCSHLLEPPPPPWCSKWGVGHVERGTANCTLMLYVMQIGRTGFVGSLLNLTWYCGD